MIQLAASASEAIAKVRTRIAKFNDLAILTGFIGSGASEFLTQFSPARTRIIFGLNIARRCLPEAQLRELKRLQRIAYVRTYSGLHAKLYLFNRQIVVIGSANLTRAGFETLQEVLLITDDPPTVRDAERLFESIWIDADQQVDRINSVCVQEPVSDATIAATLGRRPNPEFGVFGARRGNERQSSHSARPANGDSSGVSVRICAYGASWLEEEYSFETRSRNLVWTTGERSQPGDLQLFCVSKNLSGVPHLAGDPRVDAVHSLWKMTQPVAEWRGDKWRFQAPFRLVFRLENPVRFRDMARAGLISTYCWPMGCRGKVLSKPADIARLANVLAKANPSMRAQIRAALSVH